MSVPARAELPGVLWGLAPPGCFVLLLVVAFADPPLAARLMAKDDQGGLVEHLTVVLLVPAIAAGVSTLRRHRGVLPGRAAVGWVFGWTLACVYFAGEELSWGQWIFGWETPEFLRRVNTQQETNLHNAFHLLGRHPRTLVELWMVLGGLVLPLVRRRRGTRLDPAGSAAWIWPTLVCAPTAAMTLVVRVPRSLESLTGWTWLHPLGSSELREFYTAAFLMLALLSIRARALQGGGARRL